jgi:hypothetical protein
MVLRFLDFSKMEDGNMLLSTQEFRSILKLKLLSMDIVPFQMSFGSL